MAGSYILCQQLTCASRADIILEQLARNRVFLGDEGLSKLPEAFLTVVGLGGVGVGSHCGAVVYPIVDSSTSTKSLYPLSIDLPLAR